MNIASLFAVLGVNTAEAEAALNNFKQLLSSFGSVVKGTFTAAGESVKGLVSPIGLAKTAMEKFLKLLFTVTGPIFIFKIVKKDLEDLTEFMQRGEVATWRLKSAFGQSAQEYVDYSKKMQAATGESAYTFQEGVTRLRSLAQNYGITTEQIKNLSTAATDLGQVMGVNFAESHVRIESAIRGEAEAAERLGLNLQDNYMKAQAFGGALRDLWQHLSETEKAQFRYIETMKQSQFAAGKAAESILVGTGGFRVFSSAVTDAAKILWDSFKPALSSITLGFAGLGQFIVQWATNTADALGKNGLQGVLETFPKGFQDAVDIIKTILSPIIGAVLTVWGVLESKMGQIGAAIKSLVDSLSPYWKSFWALLSDVVTYALDVILPYVLVFVDKLVILFQTAYPVIAKIVEGLWETIKVIFSTAVNLIWPAISGALDLLIGIFAAANALIEGRWSDFGTYLLKASAKFLKGLVTSFDKAFYGIVDIAIQGIQGILMAFDALLRAAGLGGISEKVFGPWIRYSETASMKLNELVDGLDAVLDDGAIKKKSEEAAKAMNGGFLKGAGDFWKEAQAAGANFAKNYADGVKNFDINKAFQAALEASQARINDSPAGIKKALKALKERFGEATEVLQMSVFRAETLWEIWKAQFKGGEESAEFLAHKLQSLTEKKSALEASLPKFKSLWDEAKGSLGENADEAERLEKEYLNLQKSIAETGNEIEHLTDKLVKETKKHTAKDIDDLLDAIVDALSRKYEQMKRVELEANKQSMTAERDRHQQVMEDLSDEYKAKKKQIHDDYAKGGPKRKAQDDRISTIDREIELLRRGEKDKEELSDIEELKNKIKYEQMWGDAKKAAELQKKLDEVEAKRKLRIKIDELDDEKDGLKKQITAAEKKRDDELALLEKEIEDKRDAEEKKYKSTTQRLDNEKTAIENNYTKKLDAANTHAEAIKLIEDNNMKDIIALLNGYGDQWKILGKTYGERLVDGLKSADPLIDTWVNSALKKLNQVLSPAGFNQIIVDKLNAYISDLSKQWWDIEKSGKPDKARQDALHATAEAVRQIIGSMGSNQGTTPAAPATSANTSTTTPTIPTVPTTNPPTIPTTPETRPPKTPLRAYEDGGPIPETDIALVHAGEYMLNKGNVSAISSWLEGLNRDGGTPARDRTLNIEQLMHIDALYVRDEDDYRRLTSDIKAYLDSKLRIAGLRPI